MCRPLENAPGLRRRQALQAAWGAALATGLGGLSACGGGGGPDDPVAVPLPVPTPTPSPGTAKRGLAYDLSDARDFRALAGPVGWWTNWALQPSASVQADSATAAGMAHVPMLWNDRFDDAQVIATLKARPQVKHLLVLNEPNLIDQANMSPASAAALWPRYEDVARQTGVQLVGPAITWGTLPGHADPITWLDAFYAAYRGAHAGRDPQIDALAFHWYDYGLAAQLDRLAKYGKPFWVTEMANWHAQADGAQIDTPAKQRAQMTEMVAVCEARADVQRYAWFTGRWSPDPHFTSLLAGPGVLTELGQHYLALAARG